MSIKYLAGICPTRPGYEAFRIKPHVRNNTLTHVAATVHTVRGNVSCNWRKVGTREFDLAVTVPVNSHATIYIPTLGAAPDAVTVSESGSVIWDHGGARESVPGILCLGGKDGYVECSVGSGQYRFTLKRQEVDDNLASNLDHPRSYLAGCE